LEGSLVVAQPIILSHDIQRQTLAHPHAIEALLFFEPIRMAASRQIGEWAPSTTSLLA